MCQSRHDSENDGLINKQSRDAVTQTAISFPPILPTEVEDMLKKYQLINFETDVIQSEDNDEALDSSEFSRSMMDVSTLRRKLFIRRPQTPTEDFESNSILQLSPAPRTPQLVRNSSELSSKSLSGENKPFGSDMFGELSPIQINSPAQPSSNDVSMISEKGHKRTPRGNGYRKLRKGKNLSESFCLLHDDFKENIEDLTVEDLTVPKRFTRFDSGFSADADDDSTDFSMQF